MKQAFWHSKTLAQLSQQEWEALCDGCGKCCLHKLEDEDSGEVHYTEVACQLLDLDTCQCGDYSGRLKRVAGCVDLRSAGPESFNWLPSSCAYRLVAQGEPLPQWHHLMCGSRNRIHEEGQSVRGRVLPEASVAEEDMEDHLIYWVDA